jgi:hypothetical protein
VKHLKYCLDPEVQKCSTFVRRCNVRKWFIKLGRPRGSGPISIRKHASSIREETIVKSFWSRSATFNIVRKCSVPIFFGTAAFEKSRNYSSPIWKCSVLFFSEAQGSKNHPWPPLTKIIFDNVMRSQMKTWAE